MLQNFTHFVGQFGIWNPIILDSVKCWVPLALAWVNQYCCVQTRTWIKFIFCKFCVKKKTETKKQKLASKQKDVVSSFFQMIHS